MVKNKIKWLKPYYKRFKRKPKEKKKIRNHRVIRKSIKRRKTEIEAHLKKKEDQVKIINIINREKK